MLIFIAIIRFANVFFLPGCYDFGKEPDYCVGVPMEQIRASWGSTDLSIIKENLCKMYCDVQIGQAKPCSFELQSQFDMIQEF